MARTTLTLGLLATGFVGSFLLWGHFEGDSVDGGATRETAELPRERETERGDAAMAKSATALPDPQSPAEVRDFLAWIESADQARVPELRRMALHSSSPLVVGNAIAALGRLRRVAGDRDLMALWQDGRSRVRQELVIALGHSDDQSQVERLADLLAGEDATMRHLATEALGRLGGPRARSLLRNLRADAARSATDQAFAAAALRESAKKKR